MSNLFNKFHDILFDFFRRWVTVGLTPPVLVLEAEEELAQATSPWPRFRLKKLGKSANGKNVRRKRREPDRRSST